jgi:hypothetical protein
MKAASRGQVYRPVYREAAEVIHLIVHLWVAFVVAALAVLAVWWRAGRRVTLYAVTLQILIGIVLMVEGLKVPSYHPALAVIGWAGYMAANAMARRQGGRRNALIVAGISSLLILITYYAGMEAVKHG